MIRDPKLPHNVLEAFIAEHLDDGGYIVVLMFPFGNLAYDVTPEDCDPVVSALFVPLPEGVEAIDGTRGEGEIYRVLYTEHFASELGNKELRIWRA